MPPPRPTSPAPGRSSTATALLLAVAVCAVVGWLEIRDPFWFGWDDNASYYLPVYTYAAETLLERGEIAALNPHQYLVQTHLASGQSAVLYPPVVLAHVLGTALFGDARAALEIFALFHLVLAALGVFALLRSTGKVGVLPAALAGLAWATFPFTVVVGRSWIFVTAAAAFLPWCLLTLEGAIRRPGPGSFTAGALVRALFFLQGYVQYAILAALYEGIWLVARGLFGTLPDRRRARIGAAFVAVWTLGGLLAAPMLAPMVRAKQISAARSGSLSAEEFLSNSLEPEIVLRAQVYDMAERAVHLSTGAIFHLGLPLLVAAAAVLFVGLLRWRRGLSPSARLGLAAAATAGLALLLSTRAAGVLHGVPVLSSFRWPFKGFLFFLFLATIAAAVGLPGRPRIRTIVSSTVLAATIVGNLSILAVPGWSRPFGPNRLDRPVEAFRRETARLFPIERGRVVSMWVGHGYPDLERFLTHQWATLAGAYHLGGYDPLVARLNFELAARLEYSNIWRYELTPDSLAHLSEWSVRFLLAPASERVESWMSRFPQIRLHRRSGDLLVYENSRALPFALFADGEGPPVGLPVRFGGRGLRVETLGQGGLLRLQVAPLAGYRWSADGEDRGAPSVDGDDHLILEVPPGTRAVELRYVDVPFRLGVAASLLTGLGLAWWFVRRRPRRNPLDRSHRTL